MDPLRATGRSTRLVDEAIQTLFTTGYVEVRDHLDKRMDHNILFERVLSRLLTEHRGVKFNKGNAEYSLFLYTHEHLRPESEQASHM